MADLLALEDALARVLERARALPGEAVPLEGAAGRVLAQPARAPVDLPPFASSAMDGFALRSSDTPGTLPIAARIAAGVPAARPLEAGEAMAIATGGVVPVGADAVIPIEYVVSHDNRIDIPEAVAPGAHVRPAGGDAGAGDLLVPAGTRLGPAQLGALAAAGVPEIVCARRPTVAVLVTGSELRSPGQELGPGQIYEANGVMLAAQLASAGAKVNRLPPVADDEAALRSALERGLRSDVLVSSGGVSVGPHDLVRRIAAELGVNEVFWGVAVKPGKPLSFAVRGETLVFGLPGNPVSSLVGLELFVRPALLARQGASEPGPAFRMGVLTSALGRSPARDQLLRARETVGDGETKLEPLSGQESHMIARAAGANALVLVPRGGGKLEAGSAARYLPL